MRIRHRFALLVVVVTLLLSGFSPGAVAGQPSEQCFAETGQCIAEPFLSYWRNNGGLAINGFPLSTASPERLENGQTYTVQYFERARFEHHPENEAPFDVLLGAFGRLIYPVDPGQPRSTAVPPAPGASYFNSTGHNLGGRFRDYWEANGGLAQFGVPISEELREWLEDGNQYTVQYFERARFEHHPEHAPPYDVLLGQFGRRILSSFSTSAPLPFVVTGGLGRLYSNDLGVRVRLGVPTAAETRTPGALQQFERGLMLYRADTKTILVLARDSGNSFSFGMWSSFADTWDESQPVRGGAAPVPGVFFPQRGFGKVWAENPDVQQRLGYAISADEQAFPFAVQPFVGGLVLVGEVTTLFNASYPYLLYGSGRYQTPNGPGPYPGR